MDNQLNIFTKKIRKMLKYIKKENDYIMKRYSDENIKKLSLPLRPSKKANKKENEYINEILNRVFNPSLTILSQTIDNGIIEWAEVSKEIDLRDISYNKNFISELIYESWDKLYILKHISYNLNLNFIMQLYLYLEKELIIFIKDNYDKNFDGKTVFSAIKYIEKEFKLKINSKIKKELNLYRNVINVHKHGDGDSLLEIKKDYYYILNNVNTPCNDSSFVFNLKNMNFKKLYIILNGFLDEIELISK
jgi:hypothetical protein